MQIRCKKEKKHRCLVLSLVYKHTPPFFFLRIMETYNVIDDLATAKRVFGENTCIGSEIQTGAFIETCKAYTNGLDIIGAALGGNASSLSPTEYPKGQAIHFSGDAIASKVTLSPTNDVKCTVLVKIIPDKDQVLDDAFFLPKLEAMGQAVPQYGRHPISASTRAPDNRDYDYWTEELGEKGHVMVVSKKRGAVGKDWFILASVGAPVLAKDTYEALIGTGADWSDVTKDKQMIYLHNAARRNACRVAQRVSEKLGVCIESIIEDGTYRADEVNEAPLRTALPTSIQFTSAIVRDPHSYKARGIGMDVVSQYNQCAPAASATLVSKGKHLVAVSPLIGYALVDLPEGFRTESGIIPTTTGRQKARSDLDVRKLDPQDVKAISARFTWEGKAAGAPLVDRLHPQAYREINASFIGANFTPGLSYELLEPVIGKIATRDPRPRTTTTMAK